MKFRTPALTVWLGIWLAWAAPGAAQAPRVLDLKFDTNGLVTLTAQNVTIREVLAEWARQCGCYVVNADRLAGGPIAVPVSFNAASQSNVLRSLLRETGGYALTPRRAGSGSVSDYETIYIINASGPVSYTAQAPAVTPIVIRGAPDDEIPPVMPIVVGAEPPPAGDQPVQAPPQPRPPTPAGGFVITPVTPVTSATPITAPGAPAPGAPTPMPGQVPAQPGRPTAPPQP